MLIIRVWCCIAFILYANSRFRCCNEVWNPYLQGLELVFPNALFESQQSCFWSIMKLPYRCRGSCWNILSYGSDRHEWWSETLHHEPTPSTTIESNTITNHNHLRSQKLCICTKLNQNIWDLISTKWNTIKHLVLGNAEFADWKPRCNWLVSNSSCYTWSRMMVVNTSCNPELRSSPHLFRSAP